MLVAFAVTGCGAGGEFTHSGTPGGPGGTPAAPFASTPAVPPAAGVPGGGTPAAGPTLISPGTVTVADAGSTVRLTRGERLHVYLSSRYGAWVPPEADGDAVQRTESAGGYPSHEPARATFLATADGTATIVSRTDYACLHAPQPCAIQQRIWQVHVIVSG